MASVSLPTTQFVPAPRRVVAIVNPSSGAERGQLILRWLRNEDWSAEVATFETVPNSLAGHRAAIDYARQVGADRLIVCGGDGTLMETLTTMLASGGSIPICMVRSGTGNIVASDLQVPRRPLLALRQAFQPGKLWWWDVGQIESTGQFFALRASVGHDARVLLSMSHQAKRRWGTFAYAAAAVRELVKINPIRFTITIDNYEPFQMEGITAFVAVTNRTISHIDIVISRDIQPDDGVLHVGVLHPRGVLQRFPQNLAGILNPYGSLETSGFVTTFPLSERVKIDADPPEVVQADGELLPAKTPLVIRNFPKAAAFVTPLA